jgi:HK97 family phage portal protein
VDARQWSCGAVNGTPAQPTLRQLAAATVARLWPRLAAQYRLMPYPSYAGYPLRHVPGAYPVTPHSAQTYSAVFACMRAIAETLAMLPWTVFESDGETSSARPDVPVQYLLSKRPNPDVPAQVFREAIVMQMLAWGNAYAEIQWGNNGYPYALWQVPSWRVYVERDGAANLVYRVAGDAAGAADRLIPAVNMLHWRNIGSDGLLGLSTIELAASTISYGKEMELFGTVAFKNAPFLSGWLEYPGRLPDQQTSDNLKKSWREKYMGWLKAGETPILENGMKYNQLQLPLKDAQFLESRVFTAQEMCRWFRVPQHKIGLLEESSYANIEALEIDFFNETLLPMTIRLQQEFDYKIFEGNIRTSKFYTRHSLTPILKGNMQTRYNAYSIGMRYGLLSINDARQMEDLDKVPDGDLRTVQLNTVPLEQFAQLAQVKLEQAEADLAYRQAQTEVLEETGVAPPDAASAGGNGGGGAHLFEPSQAAAPPDDESLAATEPQALRRLQLLAMRRRSRETPARVPYPFGLEPQGNEQRYFNATARRRPHAGGGRGAAWTRAS